LSVPSILPRLDKPNDVSSRFREDLQTYLELNEELRKQEELLLAEHQCAFDQMARQAYIKKVSVTYRVLHVLSFLLLLFISMPTRQDLPFVKNLSPLKALTLQPRSGVATFIGTLSESLSLS